MEKEQFPYYFNRREYRKKELLAQWDKIEAAWDRELEALQKVPPPETSTSESPRIQAK